MAAELAKSVALSVSVIASVSLPISGCSISGGADSAARTLSAEETSSAQEPQAASFQPLRTLKNAFRDLFIADRDAQFLPSGSVMISHQAPTKTVSDLVEVSLSDHLHLLDSMQEPTALAEGVLASASQIKPDSPSVMAPLIGYFPPLMSFVPAENEVWLEVDRTTAKIAVYKGREVVKQIQGEGVVSMNTGEYFLQHKQKQPLWYAPNEYFTKRQLAVPASENRLRYRRGALGDLALYPTTTFPIHSAPLWSDEVGGLRISETDLAAIYFMLPVGAPVVVK